ncbi:MAG: UDP-N-acetylmuramyl peptide synthase [Methanosphaera sp. rholeuAM74]|nr:MAG: UDP-N-acetylmuramyl peptide synthase [Methanosphaera sp. rholeuAM74]
MVNNMKFMLAKLTGKASYEVMKVLPTGGKSFPGLLYLKIAGYDALGDLVEKQISDGSILITGTNGKTTTTTMVIDLLSRDTKLSASVGNNTQFALTTALLSTSADMGVFEYGIRDVAHGTPEYISQMVNPIGVIYTNISREHTQVAGKKNPFEDYIHAKTLLSSSLNDGIIVSNADDPNTTFIAYNKADTNKTVFYGFELESLHDEFDKQEVKCPSCGKILNYTQHYMNQRGIYECECGFKRPECDVKLTSFEQEDDKWTVNISGNPYNYYLKDKLSFDVTIHVPILGIHNLYNILCAIATYTAFTPNTSGYLENIQEYYDNLDFGILPPGRFELVNVGDKLVGIGQGDNGDALQVNTLLMMMHANSDELEFIYTTPDDNEEEIFEDHLSTIKKVEPAHLIVMPGRVSVVKAQEYYMEVEDEFNSNFYPVEFDFDKRIDKIVDLVENSDYKYIIITGCGEEIDIWESVKSRLKSLDV